MKTKYYYHITNILYNIYTTYSHPTYTYNTLLQTDTPVNNALHPLPCDRDKYRPYSGARIRIGAVESDRDAGNA